MIRDRNAFPANLCGALASRSRFDPIDTSISARNSVLRRSSAPVVSCAMPGLSLVSATTRLSPGANLGKRQHGAFAGGSLERLSCSVRHARQRSAGAFDSRLRRGYLFHARESRRVSLVSVPLELDVGVVHGPVESTWQAMVPCRYCRHTTSLCCHDRLASCRISGHGVYHGVGVMGTPTRSHDARKADSPGRSCRRRGRGVLLTPLLHRTISHQ